ncbi:MAG TPA: hypothetical protein VNJ02_13005 [Vicinamibacterales bacterium]|nr:hypothetical protein [Vicinamibacterales bacterium]
MQAGLFDMYCRLARFQFAQLGYERRRVAARGNSVDQPTDPPLDVPELLRQLALLVGQVLPFAQMNHLLDGLRRQCVFLYRLEYGFVDVRHGNT